MRNKDEILQKLHIEELNEMQEATSSAFLESNDNLILLSPTGSGKTLAYLLPLTQQIDSSSDEVQALIIVPGRELALQSATVLKDMGTGLRTCACYGGRATMDEHLILRKLMPQVIFGTPGRLNDHLDKGNIIADHIRWIIIDEFDKCLEMGFHDEMKALIDRLPSNARQILLSATPAEEMKEQHILNPHFTTLNYLTDEEQVPERINVYKVLSPEKDKLKTLKELLLDIGNASSIVFVNYRESVQRIADYLRDEGFTISNFHGGMDQKMREDQLYKFSNGSANILVSTDLASRGLDIPDIENIIHYHLPESEDGYIHRVGRTARWEAKGRSFFILGPEEDVPQYVSKSVPLYRYKEGEKPLPVPQKATLYIGKGKKDKISKMDIVGFLCKKANLTNDDIGQIDVKEHYAYVAVTRSKLSQVLKLTLGQKIKGIKTIFEEVR
jgi:ATP-independent RNA helicase DbpA